MNKKGNIITYVFSIFVFLIFWIFFLSTFLNLAGENYISVNAPTGIELMFYSNLNLVVGAILIISILTYGVLHSGGESRYG
jgi:hypothetical protein